MIGTARCAAFRERYGRLLAAQHLIEAGIDALYHLCRGIPGCGQYRRRRTRRTARPPSPGSARCAACRSRSPSVRRLQADPRDRRMRARKFRETKTSPWSTTIVSGMITGRAAADSSRASMSLSLRCGSAEADVASAFAQPDRIGSGVTVRASGALASADLAPRLQHRGSPSSRVATSTIPVSSARPSMPSSRRTITSSGVESISMASPGALTCIWLNGPSGGRPATAGFSLTRSCASRPTGTRTAGNRPARDGSATVPVPCSAVQDLPGPPARRSGRGPCRGVRSPRRSPAASPRPPADQRGPTAGCAGRPAGRPSRPGRRA